MNAAHIIPRETRLRAAVYGLVGALATALLIGIPTVLIPNPFFSRMVPVRPQDYGFLTVTVLLTGVLAATYALPATCPLQEGKLATGGFLSFIAVGCPVCNKIVVLAVGASGAMSYFAPIQPLIAVASTLLLGY
ncbi:MAG TPA: hypothetical protein VHV31_13000, partial [Nitrolancea sp.]|nr:hypothetical protein [Nitrolancea sp.]